MKYFILIPIWLLWLIGILFIAFTIGPPNATADDYIITIYGGGEVIVIEHDDEITAFGCGDQTDTTFITKDGHEVTYAITQAESESEPSDLEWAQRYEAREMWYPAGMYYKDAGEIEKAKEMGLKDIDEELARETPGYFQASATARKILEDKDLALFYYEKYLEQPLSK